MVIDFFANWCGPCKFIAPYLEKMAYKYKNLAIAKVDGDIAATQDLMKKYNINCFPTFIFIKDGK